uniref:Uncharacterized protein n=1 Tax=Pristionchus pacificus TaxID=54126 RepID=A0A8R1YD00_PRIPA
MSSREGIVSDSSNGWNGTKDRVNMGTIDSRGNTSLFWEIVCDIGNDDPRCATTQKPMDDQNITMDPVGQPVLTGQGIVYVCAVVFNLLLLYMSIFGQRMTGRASRWHIMNVSFWNVVSTVFYSSYGDRTPWANYMNNANIEKYYPYIKQYCFTTFHNGMILVFVETLIVFFKPSLDKSFIFSMIWFFLICIFANGTLLFCFLSRLIWGDAKVDAMFWYDPISLYQVVIVVAFGIIIPIYILTAIIATVVSCICRIKHRGDHHFELWSTLWYGIIPYPPFILTTGFMFAQFINNRIPQIYQWGSKFMMEMFRKPPPGTGGTGGSTGAGELNFVEMMQLAGKIMEFFVDVITWTEACIPLLEAICAFLFFTSYMQQLLFLISCGRCYPGKRNFTQKVLPPLVPDDKLFYPTGINPQNHLPTPPTSEKMDVIDEIPSPPLISATPVRLLSPPLRPPLEPVIQPSADFEVINESPTPPSSYHSPSNSPSRSHASSPTPDTATLPSAPPSDNGSDGSDRRVGTSSPTREIVVTPAGDRLYSSYKQSSTHM